MSVSKDKRAFGRKSVKVSEGVGTFTPLKR